MAKFRGKKYRDVIAKVPAQPVPLSEAINVVKDLKVVKFDPTVELVMQLGIDPKQADQLVRGAVSLPHGIGASRKVIAFCDGEDIERAKAAGAIEAGTDELVKKVQDGWMDFDVAIATAPMMRIVSRLGRVLGPQGKMPSPKAGTVVEDVAKAVAEYAAGKVEYRNDDGGNIHAIVGKLSFDNAKIQENAQAFMDHIRRVKPAAAKGQYVKKVFLSATMSPAVQIVVE